MPISIASIKITAKSSTNVNARSSPNGTGSSHKCSGQNWQAIGRTRRFDKKTIWLVHQCTDRHAPLNPRSLAPGTSRAIFDTENGEKADRPQTAECDEVLKSRLDRITRYDPDGITPSAFECPLRPSQLRGSLSTTAHRARHRHKNKNSLHHFLGRALYSPGW